MKLEGEGITWRQAFVGEEEYGKTIPLNVTLPFIVEVLRQTCNHLASIEKDHNLVVLELDANRVLEFFREVGAFESIIAEVEDLNKYHGPPSNPVL